MGFAEMPKNEKLQQQLRNGEIGLVTHTNLG